MIIMITIILTIVSDYNDENSFITYIGKYKHEGMKDDVEIKYMKKRKERKLEFEQKVK